MVVNTTVKTFSDTIFESWYEPLSKEYSPLSHQSRINISKGRDTNLIILSARTAFSKDDYNTSQNLFLSAIVRSRTDSINYFLANIHHNVSYAGHTLSPKFPFSYGKKSALDSFSQAFQQYDDFLTTLNIPSVKDSFLVRDIAFAFHSVAKDNPLLKKFFSKKLSHVAISSYDICKPVNDLFSCFYQIAEKANTSNKKPDLSDTIADLWVEGKKKLDDFLQIKFPKEIL